MNQEQRFAKDIVRRLDETTQHLAPEISTRLAEARRRALLRATAQNQQSQGGGLMALFGSYFAQYHRIFSWAALIAAIFFTFIVTQQLTGHGHGEHGDAFLLASELPPEAYLDPGFYSWLKQQ
ncbi:DUF3619 family protein [Methylobacillus flagellatus]|uniref:Putative transmembrane protein n=1 Tax=Methylobacillus flagellatus (strain ATCC 51484 / DSM 6875 / VKM B-1610 / KT) TaxID=265072 RepID=Q1H4U8_METFK|nr:DUF3619 family protein [Methylobacillus flagellatus]ABE48489.1 putative transmembrane protein [Methylobacillus flagellatus KT]